MSARSCMHLVAGAMRTVSSNHAASGCYPEVFLFFLRQILTMDTLAALGWSSCATGAGAASHVEAPARLLAQHQNPAKRRTALALLSHDYLAYSVASDKNRLETSHGLGTGGAGASRHRCQAAPDREGEKARNIPGHSLQEVIRVIRENPSQGKPEPGHRNIGEK